MCTLGWCQGGSSSRCLGSNLLVQMTFGCVSMQKPDCSCSFMSRRSRRRTRHGRSKRGRSKSRRRSSSNKRGRRDKKGTNQSSCYCWGLFVPWFFGTTNPQLLPLADLCSAGQPKNRDDESTDAESAFGLAQYKPTTEFTCKAVHFSLFCQNNQHALKLNILYINIHTKYLFCEVKYWTVDQYLKLL